MTRTPPRTATALLLELHELTGNPSHRALSGYTSVSATTLWNVLRGEGQPRPSTVDAFICACLEYARQHRRFVRLGQDQWSLAHWRDRYNALTAPEPSVEVGPRSWYREQVRRIAPTRLVGREYELAELATFCTGSGDPYVYWRAEAWSGKSALMSWFVLHPPAGVRIVSFFVTARLANQNDRAAFIDNLVEQLVTLLGQDIPPFLTDATREPYLFGLLNEAADACRGRGERLVLLVDGLDEDRGVTTSPDAHSIAGLLPAHPPGGMRIVVSGRPHPPVPWDVPEHHPLCDPAIVRTLAPAPAAQAVRAEMERELKRLLHGTQAEQDLLGVLTAAGGGLTAGDLAALTGLTEWAVHDQLRTVTGRSFTRRRAGDTGPEVYLLSHEQLQATAHDVLDPVRLAAYRQRVHEWADHYRDRRWPEGTPDYLLHGYPNTLAATGDLSRMVACATDLARQDRLLETTGGDTTALAQLMTTQNRAVAQNPPDLAVLARLAVHRDHLHSRNSHVPAELPGRWAALGRPSRAEALARSAGRLLEVVPALAAHGERRRALEILAELSERERATPGTAPNHRVAGVVRTMAEIGEVDSADELARSIVEPGNCYPALVTVVTELVARNERERATEVVAHAEALARPRPDVPWTDRTAPPFAEALLELGDRDRAAEVFVECERYGLWQLWVRLGDIDLAENLVRQASTDIDMFAELAGGHDEQSGEMARLVAEVAAVGEFDRAEALAESISYKIPRDDAFRSLATALAAAGHAARAETVARTIADPVKRSSALVATAAALEPERAIELVDQVVADSQEIGAGSEQILASAAAVLFGAGEPDRARDLVDRAAAGADAQLLTSLAKLLIDVGESHRAEALVRRAEHSARATGRGLDEKARVAALVRLLIEAGDLDRAEARCLSLVSRDEREEALTPVVTALAEAGQFDRAEPMARSVRLFLTRRRQMIAVATALAQAGEFDRAEALASTLDRADRNSALTSLAAALSSAGRHERAAELATQILTGKDVPWDRDVRRTLLRVLIDADQFDRAMAATRASRGVDEHETMIWMTTVIAEVGGLDRAIPFAYDIPTPGTRCVALAALARAAATDDSALAAELLTRTEAVARAHPDCEALITLARALHDLGQHDRATDILTEALAHSGAGTRSRSHLVAKALADLGEYDRATTVSRGIDDERVRARALRSIIEAMADAGELARAETLLRQLPDHRPLRAKLAESAVRSGEYDRADELLPDTTDPEPDHAMLRVLARSDSPHRMMSAARLLVLRPWHEVLDTVVHLDPSLLHTVIDELAILNESELAGSSSSRS